MMNADPCVSVIVPCYNSAQTIDACLASLERQTYDNIEIVIVDDGSSDDTFSKVEQFVDSSNRRFVLKTTSSNKGPSAARNEGLRAAKGEYVAFVDSDDVVDQTMIEKMVQNSILHESDLVTCGRHNVDPVSGEVIKSIIPSYREIRGSLLQSPEITRRTGNLMCDKLFKLRIIDEHGIRFDESIRHAEDFLFLCLYREHVRCVSAVEEPLYRYMKNNAESLSGSSRYILDIPRACRLVVDEYRGKGLFEATGPHLLHVFLGLYLRRADNPRNDTLKRFNREFQDIFRRDFPRTWRRALRARAKRMFGKRRGLLVAWRLSSPAAWL